jgi:hypothetical protein
VEVPPAEIERRAEGLRQAIRQMER